MNIPGTYLTLLPRDLQQMINVYISHMNLNLETLIAILSIHFRYLSKDSVDSLIIQVNRIFTDEGLMIRIICKYNHLTKFVGFFTTDVIMNVNLQVQNEQYLFDSVFKRVLSCLCKYSSRYTEINTLLARYNSIFRIILTHEVIEIKCGTIILNDYQNFKDNQEFWENLSTVNAEVLLMIADNPSVINANLGCKDKFSVLERIFGVIFVHTFDIDPTNDLFKTYNSKFRVVLHSNRESKHFRFSVELVKL